MIAVVQESGAGGLDLGFPPPKGAEAWESRRPSMSSYPALSAAHLVGRTAVLRKGEGKSPRGVIKKVYARKGDPDVALVELRPDPDEEQPIPLTSLCIENPTGLTVRALEKE